MAPFPREVLPLLLDRVLEGRPIASPSSILFTIPVEILTLILRYVALDKRDLASLALVNSDCRQLARSCQFATVTLDFGSHALQIVAKLQQEAVQRMRSPQGLTHSPSLGACVRTLRSSTSEYWPRLMAFRPRGEQNQASDDQWRDVADLLTEEMETLYLPAVMLVTPTLPHLESLQSFECNLNDELLDCLGMSKAKHLKLSGTFLEAPKMRGGRHPWPLETLHADLKWEFRLSKDSPIGLDSSSFWQALLGMCSSTLRELKLDQPDLARAWLPTARNRGDKPISFNLEFPNLKALFIASRTSLDAVALSCLLRADLSILQVDYDDPITRQVLSEADPIPTLETLILSGHGMSYSDPLRFVEINTQITSIACLYNQRDAFLRCVIRSLIHHGDLRKLSLLWIETEIPEESLDELALLSQVEVLHLSAGFQGGFPHDWFVDHNKLKMYLSRFVNLKRLIITRDTYRLPLPERDWYEPNRYYDYRRPEDEELWGRHESQMLEHASAYVQALPKLAFVHLGKINFAVEEVNGTRKPVVTGEAWNTEYNVMKKEFQIDVN
ncbi:hypothetical protein SLS62_004810 [Diatrype stigma]|uniref:F-box domain-containing protein n=1 Tax=Diatrype stigma TaxID=117547 RepID=A0AAN9YQ98_9PEZI